jgi:ABC-type amino acid transport substrate-binding protein
MSLGEKVDEYSFNYLVIDDVPSPKSLFQMIASGRLDYGIFYRSTGKKEVEKYNLTSTIESLPKVVATEGLSIAFSKNSQCQTHITLLNNEIKKMAILNLSLSIIIQRLLLRKWRGTNEKISSSFNIVYLNRFENSQCG